MKGRRNGRRLRYHPSTHKQVGGKNATAARRSQGNGSKAAAVPTPAQELKERPDRRAAATAGGGSTHDKAGHTVQLEKREGHRERKQREPGHKQAPGQRRHHPRKQRPRPPRHSSHESGQTGRRRPPQKNRQHTGRQGALDKGRSGSRNRDNLRTGERGDGEAPATGSQRLRRHQPQPALTQQQATTAQWHQDQQPQASRPTSTRAATRRAGSEGGGRGAKPAVPRKGQRATAGDPVTATRAKREEPADPNRGEDRQHPRLSPPAGALNWAPPSSRAVHPPPPPVACGDAPIRRHPGALNWAPSAGRRPTHALALRWRPHQDPLEAPTRPHQQGDAHRRGQARSGTSKRQQAARITPLQALGPSHRLTNRLRHPPTTPSATRCNTGQHALQQTHRHAAPPSVMRPP